MPTGPTLATVHQVWTRDEGCCARCGSAITGTRGIDWSVHHRAPRSMGGSKRAWINSPANLVILDGSGVTGCHGWVERNRDAARDAGFLISANGTLTASQVLIEHAIHSAVYLCEDGTTTAEIRQPILSSTERKES